MDCDTAGFWNVGQCEVHPQGKVGVRGEDSCSAVGLTEIRMPLYPLAPSQGTLDSLGYPQLAHHGHSHEYRAEYGSAQSEEAHQSYGVTVAEYSLEILRGLVLAFR